MTASEKGATGSGGRVPLVGRSLGRRSRGLKRRVYLRRFGRALVAAMAIWIGAMVLGLVAGGLGIEGLITTFFLMAAAFGALLLFPRMRAPSAASLEKSDLSQLAGNTEIYLEAQRGRLPAPAQQLLERLGTELDQLAPQLETLDERQPAAHEARRLLGEHLPGLIESYTRIPPGLRREAHAGSTPEQELLSGLEVISREIGTLTGQIARGELDALATRGRYLETKYAGTRPDGSGSS